MVAQKMLSAGEQSSLRSSALSGGVLNQGRTGTCYAAASAKAMADAAGESGNWMLNRYMELVSAFGGKGADPADAMQSVCNTYGLYFQNRTAADAVGWVGTSGTGIVLSFAVSESEMDYFQKHHKLVSPPCGGAHTKAHAMAMVGKTGGDYVIQNSWGPTWKGEGMQSGRCSVSWNWLIHENANLRFWTVRRPEPGLFLGNAYAGRGVAGAGTQVVALRDSNAHLDAGGLSAEVQANSSGVEAAVHANLVEAGLHNQYVGAHVGLQADTGVAITSQKFEVGVLGFGIRAEGGAMQLRIPFAGVTFGDAGRFMS